MIWHKTNETSQKPKNGIDIGTLQFDNWNIDNGNGTDVLALANEEIWVVKMSCKGKVTKLKSHPPIPFAFELFGWTHSFFHFAVITFCNLCSFMVSFGWLGGITHYYFFTFLRIPNTTCMLCISECLFNTLVRFLRSYHQMKTHNFICRTSNLTDSWHFSRIFLFFLLVCAFWRFNVSVNACAVKMLTLMCSLIFFILTFLFFWELEM